ncbi:MAG: hypothetical protein U5J97_02480 [Trueperaceae bacterium]|nr:hypothetical protein [Trueperaceae bacterium]
MAREDPRVDRTTGPARHGSRLARAGAALLAAVALAALTLAACAPRATPVTTNDAPLTPGVVGDARPALPRSAGCDTSSATASPDRVVVAGSGANLPGARSIQAQHAGHATSCIVFHGRTNDAAQVRRYVGLDAALSDAVVVYPRALPVAPGVFAWAAPGDPPDRQRDFALVGALIRAFGDAHCLEPRSGVRRRSLAGRVLRERRRVSPRRPGPGGGVGRRRASTRRVRRGAAALLVHHPDDRLVPLGEGAAARDAFRDANALGAVPAAPVADGPLARLRCVRHGAADTLDPVVWCARDDATTPSGGYDPHTWPVGAAAAIGAFFTSLP